jgi:hypothetical protein
MSSRVVILFPRKPSRGSRLWANLAEVVSEVVTVERTHARLACGVAAVGLIVGLALQSL